MLNQYFQENSQSKIHGLNCLALALLWQGKTEEAIIELNKALDVKTSNLNSKNDRIIIIAEGDPKNRTLMNLAQAYSKKNSPEKALDCAQKALEEKIKLGRPEEDIAYTKIVVGEIHLKLNNKIDAEKYLREAIVTYNKLYGSNEDHMHKNRAKELLEQLEINPEMNHPEMALNK